MSDAAAEQQWKIKYRELLRDFEHKEREWASVERALRNAAGKLTMAAMGQSTALDTALGSVADALRGNADASALDAGMSAVVRQLHVHEARP